MERKLSLLILFLFILIHFLSTFIAFFILFFMLALHIPSTLALRANRLESFAASFRKLLINPLIKNV